MAIIGFLAVTVLMAVKSENLIYEDIYKGIHDDDNNVWSCRPTIFSISATCSVCCERCERLS